MVEAENRGTIPSTPLRIDLADGAKLSVARSGIGYPCILIHGFGEGSYVWRDFTDDIKGLSTFAVDLRGHADSDWAADGQYSTRRYVSDIMSLVDQFRLGQFILIGHSLGAAISVRIASAFPQHVRAMALLDYCPQPSGEAGRHVREDFRESVCRRYRSTDDYIQDLLRSRPLLDPAVAIRIAEANLKQDLDGRLRLKADPAIAEVWEDDDWTYEDAWRNVGALRCLTFLIRGQASAVVSAHMAQRFCAAIPGGVLRTVPAAGHSLLFDNPKATIALLKEFIRMTMGGGGSL